MKESAEHSKWLTTFLHSLEENLAALKAEGNLIKKIYISSDLMSKLFKEYGYEISDLLGYVVELNDEMIDDEKYSMQLGFLCHPIQ